MDWKIFAFISLCGAAPTVVLWLKMLECMRLHSAALKDQRWSDELHYGALSMACAVGAALFFSISTIPWFVLWMGYF